MSAEFTLALITATLSFITSLFAFFVFRWIRNSDKDRKKILESQIVSTEVADIEKLNPIIMTVEMGHSKVRQSSKKQVVSVKRAYKHIVKITNVGTDDIQKPEIVISFDDKASIVAFDAVVGDVTKDKIKIQKESLYRYKVTPEYINKRNRMTISVLSINNELEKCNLVIYGLGITHQTRAINSKKSISGYWVIGIFMTIFLAFALYLIR